LCQENLKQSPLNHYERLLKTLMDRENDRGEQGDRKRQRLVAAWMDDPPSNIPVDQ
jgi:hypothetical protein